MDQVVITIGVIFGMVLFLIFTAGLLERKELREKITNDFEYMKRQFDYGTFTFNNRKDNTKEMIRLSYHYTCFDLRLEIYGTSLVDLNGLDNVLKRLESGHRTRALNALLDLQREWEEKGFKILGRRKNEYKL